nr:AIG1-like protein [Tanacetum cinerariifolium]
MDENTVRLWLKDHQDATEKLARQQAEAFQLQLDTLCGELQATRAFTDVGFNLEGSTGFSGCHGMRELLTSKPTTLSDVFSLARITDARLDDQAAPMAGTSAKTFGNNGDSEVEVLNWVQQAIDVKSTSDNDAQDQASELETNVLVDGKQDEAKVVKVVGVTNEQNSDEPNVLEDNEVIGVGRFNDKHIRKKKMEAAIQRRLWDPRIKNAFQDNTLRTRWFLKV